MTETIRVTRHDWDELKIAVISDIHIGHRRTPTSKIVENLRASFPDNGETADLDILFISGDVFDDLLPLPNEAVWLAQLWIADLLSLCAKHEIVVRVLEGTPGHDWQQSTMFETVKEVAGIDVDLEYVKTLSIGHIERYGISVLYVPDEWNTSTDKTLSQVRELLKAKGLTQVDFAVMHGQFTFQLPQAAKAPKHDEASYLEIVKYLIFIGHDHTHKRYDRIFVPSSHDRLKHREEEPKGHLRATVWRHGEYKVEFRETKGAMRYITLDAQETLQETFEYLDRSLSKVPIGSHVRISGQAGHPVFDNLDEVVKRFPLFQWSKDVKIDKLQEELVQEDEVEFTPVTITSDNIVRMVVDRFVANGVDSAQIEQARLILEELK